MNGTNKAIVGVVFGIALAYSMLCLLLTVSEILDTGAVSLFLFAPHEGDMGFDLSEIGGLDEVVGLYGDFVALFGDSEYVSLAVVLAGYILAAAGMATSWSTGVRGGDNPVEYLWTMRPGAVRRGLLAPWGLIPAAWGRHKALVVVPVILLPLYAVWSIQLTLLLVVPFLLVKGLVGLRVRSAARREGKAFAKITEYAVCPVCKRSFERPKVKCRCGLMVEYPVPNMYGYKVHTCYNGHSLPCTAGKRGDLITCCPYCEAEIDTREARPITIAMVGAQGSGKTAMMLAAVDTIMRAARSRDVAVEAATPGVSKQAVAAREFAAKTASGELDSECIFLRSRDMSVREIVFNDISGSEFEPKEDRTLFEEYYNYSDGIVFAFDPVALVRSARAATPSQVFESFHNIYAQIRGTGPSAVSDARFAIVATRADVVDPPLAADGVRQFLVDNGQNGFVMTAEAVFSEVRYFSVCSKGEECSSAAAPFWWIVAGRDPQLASKVPVGAE